MKHLKRKLMMTLALLLTAATSAWAESKPIGLNVEYAAGDVITSTTDVYVWWGYYYSPTTIDPEEGVIMITSNNPATISEIENSGNTGYINLSSNRKVISKDGSTNITTNDQVQCQGKVTGTLEKVHVVSGSGTLADPYVFAPGSAPSAATATTVPLTWDAATPNTATLTNGMPAGNVTVSVEYFPQAAFAMSTDATPVALAPKASTSARANTDDPLVEGGTVGGIVDGEALLEEGQGTLLYHFSAKQLDADALEALTATDWTDKVPTADGLAESTVYVYYYIKGADDQPGITQGAKFTFSDSDIQELAVTLAPEPTYNVEFAEGTNPEAPAEPIWTASPATGVKKGQTVTVTYTGDRKVIGVKAEKKAAPKLLEFEPRPGVKFYYYEGETWGEAINNHPENKTNGWSIDEDDNVMNNGQELHETNNDDNIKSETPVNPNIGYSLG